MIRSIHLHNVRNHEQSELSFVPDVNILTGGNGSGKTSVLEALSLCAIARSFVPVQDQALIRHGEDSCSASVHATTDLQAPYHVNVILKHGVRKRISTSTQSSCSPRDIIGTLPIVVLSPDHKAITVGAPAERRAFVDAVMAQAQRRYTELLYEHRRLHKHRGALLSAIADGHASEQDLDLWTEQFISVSAEIVERRWHFLNEISPRICSTYASVTGGSEEIDIAYQPDVAEHVPTVDISSAHSVADAYRDVARKLRRREIARQTTMFGPQKDDVALLINGGLVRETASQGQHKSLLVALKLAESTILQEHCNERPVVLLDDVFSELDADRCRRVLDHVISMNMQCFVTTTDGHQVRSVIDSVDRLSRRDVSIQMSTVVEGKITASERSIVREAA